MQGQEGAPVLAAPSAFRQRGGPWSARARAMAGVAMAAVAVACFLSLPSAQRQSANGGTAAALTGTAAWQRLPIGARAVISRTIGAGSPTFAAHPTPAGYRLAGGGVTATLGRRSVRVGAGTRFVALTLTALGRDRTVAKAALGRPVADANRVTYGFPGVREWYAGGPLGIEQGFSVAHRPDGEPGQLTLSLRLGGPLVARQVGATLLFLAHGHVVLRYGGLEAADAAGRSLPASMALRGTQLTLRVIDRRAAYPVTIDPFIELPQTLAEGTNTSSFGWSVAVSGNADTALVGGFNDGGGSGAAWVFARSGTGWALQHELVGDGTCTSNCSGPVGSGESAGAGQFGTSVALSADGNTALVGAPADSGTAGAVWVFTRSGTSWSQSGSKLTVASTSLFGQSVALSTNGSTALIGAPGLSGHVGQAFVFTGSSGTGWSQHAPLTPASGCAVGAPRFGFSVALSRDGTTALVGGPNDNSSDGAAWVFTGSSTGPWSEQSKLVGDGQNSCPVGTNGTGETAGGNFGWSVALSPDGGTALVGAPADHADGQGLVSDGAAWLFTLAGTTWSESSGKLIGDCLGACSGPNGTGETSQGQFGTSVALSNGGATALIGGSSDASGNGGVWAFTGSPATGWSQNGPELVSGTSGAVFGQSAALSSDGATALIGGPSTGSGTAWTFVQPPACSNTAATAPAGGGSVPLTLSCSGPLGAPLSYALVSGPGSGTLSAISSNGTVTYTSRAGFAGTDTITYQASDSGGSSTPAMVTITVPPARPTCANVSSRTAAGGGGVTVSLSCTAPNNATITYAITSQPSHGGLGALNQAGGTVPYASQKGFSGSDAFTYVASDSGGTSAPATATITIPHGPPPSVAIVGDSTPVVGQASTYSASVIDTTATPNRYQWTIDGHNAGSAGSVRHTFTSGGKHSIVLRVSDTAGSTQRTSLNVNPSFRRLAITILWTDDFTPSWTKITSLAALAVPQSTVIQASCHGEGCPFARHTLSVRTAPTCHAKKCVAAHKHPPKTRDVDLSGLVRGARLHAGVRIQISFVLKYFEGQSTVFTIDSAGLHRATRCLTPGTTKVARHC
jgi:Bacterial Ig domain/PKD domain